MARGRKTRVSPNDREDFNAVVEEIQENEFKDNIGKNKNLKTKQVSKKINNKTYKNEKQQNNQNKNTKKNIIIESQTDLSSDEEEKSTENTIFPENVLAQDSENEQQIDQDAENMCEEIFGNSDEGKNQVQSFQEHISAQKMLDASYTPELVKNRDSEQESIKKFLQRCFNLSQKVRCLLLTGNPGTGKTLLTNYILNQLEEKSLDLGMEKNKVLRVLRFNGMNFKNAIEFFKNMHQQLHKKDKLPSLNKRILLEQIQQYFEVNKKEEVIFLVDEFDRLFEGAGTDIFEIFGLINKTVGASIIGISNSIEMFQNLTERFQIQLPKIRNIVFKPYDRQQFAEIMQERINLIKTKLDIESNIFEGNAIKQCSAIIFNKGGDVRSLLDICKRTLQQKVKSLKSEKLKEYREAEDKKQFIKELLNNMEPIKIVDLRKVVDETFSNKKLIRVIQALPTIHLILLSGIYQIIEKDQEKLEIKIQEIQSQFNRIGKDLQGGIERIDLPSLFENLKILEAYKLLKLRNVKQKEKVTVILDITLEEIEKGLELNQTLTNVIKPTKQEQQEN